MITEFLDLKVVEILLMRSGPGVVLVVLAEYVSVLKVGVLLGLDVVEYVVGIQHLWLG